MAAKNYTEILALVNAGNQMGLSNTIKRDYGIPLDFTSVQQSYDDAVIYAAENTKAYVGQPISVGGKLYIINDVAAATKHVVGEKEYDNYLVEVGSATEGDGASIDLENKVLTLHGFESALTGYLPRKAEDGTLEWVPISAVVQGDGNKVTTLTSDDGSVTITKTTDTDDSLVYDLSVAAYDDTDVKDRLDAIEEEIGEKAEGENEATGIYKVIDEALAEAKKYADEQDADTIYDDTALANRVKAIEDDYLKTEDKYDDTALAGRVEVVEGKVVTLEETVGNADGGLVKDIADEIERAKAAEKELDDAIKAIDFVDPAELADAIKDFATVEYVGGEIDKIEEAIANLNHFKAEVVDDIAKVTEIGVLYLIKDESAAGVDKYNEYIVVDGQPVLIGDTTTDLSNYYNKTEIDGKIAALEEGIADEATARGELADRVADLEAIETVTQDEFETYKGEVTTAICEAKQAAIDDADGKLALKANTADVVANDTFESFKTENAQAIADARVNAVADVEAKGYAVADEVAQTYATKSDLEDHSNTMATTLNDYAKKADVEDDLATKIDKATISHSTDEKAEGATVNGTQLDIVVDAFTKAETRQYVADTIKTMTGGESAADVKLLLENHIADYEEKVGQIDAKNGEQDTAIAAAQAQADKGVADAKAAADAIAELANGQVNTNKTDIDAVKGRLTTLETAKGDHETRIAAAEGKITSLETATNNNATAIGALQGKDTELVAEDDRLAGLIEALGTSKANTADVYTKGEVDTKVQEAIDAIPEVDFTPYAKTADVNAALDLKANVADVYTKTDADGKFMTEEQVDDRLNALINAADPEGGKVITDIQNLVKYVDENADDIAALVTATGNNTAKLAGIETTVTDYLATALATIVQPKASTEVTVAEDGTLGIGEVNVNKLVQSEGDTFIIDGGRA